MSTNNEWVMGLQAWINFTEHHPELGLKAGRWQFHNFLRFHREALVARDAIRKARGRWWIAHLERLADDNYLGRLTTTILAGRG